MKNNKFLLFMVVVIGLAGCQKLDRDFLTTSTREQIEQSFGNVQALLNGVYADMPDGLLWIDGAAMMASATDEAEFTSEVSRVQAFNTGSWNAISNPDLVWGTYYRAIRKANQFLLSTTQINLSPFTYDSAVYKQNQVTIKRWTFEARLLRAFYYFELVKRYGGVPLFKTALTIEDDFTKTTRNSLEECIDFIVSECDAVRPELPLKGDVFPYLPANDLGRVTKLTALALKARVLLYAASDLFNNPTWAGGYAKPELISLPTTTSRADRWKRAADAAKAVIDTGGAITLGNYKSLFNTNNNTEIILARTTAASNTFEKNNSPIGFASINSGNANTPSQDLVDAYDVKVNATTAVKFDWTNPAMAAAPYANRDPRLAMSVVLNNTNFGTTTSRTNLVQLWNGGIDGKPIVNASKTGYYLRKYMNESLNVQLNNTVVHAWIIFRFPEFYLAYAEALNEYSPGNADIKKYYDLVRNRAGVVMPLLPAGLSQSAVRDAIRNERRVEFAFEDHRNWDVRRWMIAPQTLGAPLRGVEIAQTGTNTFTYTPAVVEQRVFEPKMYLYPIPQGELNISPLLVQNPLW